MEKQDYRGSVPDRVKDFQLNLKRSGYPGTCLGVLRVLKHPPPVQLTIMLYSKQTWLTWDMAIPFHSRQVARYL